MGSGTRIAYLMTGLHGLGRACLRAKFHLDQCNGWPGYTNIKDRQTGQDTDRQDNGPIAYGEPFYNLSPN